MSLLKYPQRPPVKSKVFLVDDHPVVRQGLAQLLNRELDLIVCGEAESARDALRDIPAADPDITVIDISLQGPDGLELLKRMRSRWPMLKVLVLSMCDESVYAERALRAGANGYIMKQEATSKLLLAIRQVLEEGNYVSENIVACLLKRYVHASEIKPESPMSLLSDRELEIFCLIGKGYTTARIANDLNLSLKTVESHQGRLKNKLSLPDGRSLVREAIRWAVAGKIGD